MKTPRTWTALYSEMLRHTKYRKLSVAGRAGLLHVLLLAGGTSPEATWHEAELLETLILDGFSADAMEPDSAARVLQELGDLGWLDRDADRWIFHNWDKWQLAVSQEVAQAYEADRKQQWRLKKSQRSSADRTGQREDKREHDMGPGRVRDVSRTFVPSEGPCRGCGEAISDGDPGVHVGQGWIAHTMHAG